MIKLLKKVFGSKNTDQHKQQQAFITELEKKLTDLSNKLVIIENKMHGQSIKLQDISSYQYETGKYVSSIRKDILRVEKNLFVQNKKEQKAETKSEEKIDPTMVSNCNYCGDTFVKKHRLQKYCPTKYGKKDYCKYQKKINDLKKQID
jgi:hypothetical protein